MTYPNLNSETLAAFRSEYDPKKGQRWGQAVVNHFGLRGKTWDHVFYLKDPAEVDQILREHLADIQA
jgi:hypothetical protein